MPLSLDQTNNLGAVLYTKTTSHMHMERRIGTSPTHEYTKSNLSMLPVMHRIKIKLWTHYRESREKFRLKDEWKSIFVNHCKFQYQTTTAEKKTHQLLIWSVVEFDRGTLESSWFSDCKQRQTWLTQNNLFQVPSFVTLVSSVPY